MVAFAFRSGCSTDCEARPERHCRGVRQRAVSGADGSIHWRRRRAISGAAESHARRCRALARPEGYVLDVIKREVLSRKRRALVLYGDGHLRRYSKWRGSDESAQPTLLNGIEGQGTRAFAIWTNTTVELERLQKDIRTWPIPGLTIVRGTRLGALDFKYFAGRETDPPTRMEEQYDAVLYLGPVS